MSFLFNPHSGLIVVEAILEGPKGAFTLSLILDTGARVTFVRDSVLSHAGYNPSLAAQKGWMTTASNIIQVPRLPVTRLSSLGHDRLNLLVAAHTLPPTAAFDGLLGLDFFRGHVLKIDFLAGLIDLL
jgi:hypothetical protein